MLMMHLPHIALTYLSKHIAKRNSDCLRIRHRIEAINAMRIFINLFRELYKQVINIFSKEAQLFVLHPERKNDNTSNY